MVSPSQLRMTKGQSQTVQCSLITGSTPVSFTWRKRSGTISRNIRTLNGRLQITNYDPLVDSGEYVCTATNMAGSVHSTLGVDSIGESYMQ